MAGKKRIGLRPFRAREGRYARLGPHRTGVMGRGKLLMYYRIKNWEKFQNADVAKKSPNGVLPWVKLWTHDDYDLGKQPYYVRLLFVEMLKLAGREMNAIEADLGWISSRVEMAPEDVSQGIVVLLKEGWLSETKTARRSRNESRFTSRPTKTKNRKEEIRGRATKWVERVGWQFADLDLLDFLNHDMGIKDAETARELLAIGQRIRRAKELETQDPLAPVIDLDTERRSA